MSIKEIMDRLNLMVARYKTLNRSYFAVGAVAVGLVVFGAIRIGTDKENVSALLQGVVMILVAAVVLGSVCTNGEKEKDKLEKNFVEEYKSELIPMILKNQFDNFAYDWRQGFDKTQAADYVLMNANNEFLSEDLLTGEYKGVRFEQASVRTVTPMNYSLAANSNSQTPMPDFTGRMIKFHAEGKEVEFVKIYSRKFKYKSKFPRDKEFKKVILEDVAFNNRFEVDATKAEDAFYVLTPHMMQTIKDLTEKYESLEICFRGMDIIIVYYIDSYHKQSYEPSIFEKLDYYTENVNIKKHFGVITDFINELNLEREEQ